MPITKTSPIHLVTRLIAGINRYILQFDDVAQLVEHQSHGDLQASVRHVRGCKFEFHCGLEYIFTLLFLYLIYFKAMVKGVRATMGRAGTNQSEDPISF